MHASLRVLTLGWACHIFVEKYWMTYRMELAINGEADRYLVQGRTARGLGLSAYVALVVLGPA